LYGILTVCNDISALIRVVWPPATGPAVGERSI
jgi:hypothetical protein